MRHFGLMAPLILVAAASGCKSKARDGVAARPSASNSASSVGATAAHAAKEGDAGYVDPAEEKRERALFVAALAKGRGALAKKDFKAALTAYDDAVKYAPYDAAARGERGYARLLSGDPSGAENDLVAARDLGATPKVAGQIWFNLGLVRARRGDDAGARLAFATSEAIAPSPAAEKKLAGLSVCTAELDSGGDMLKKVSGFDQAATLMGIDYAAVADAGAKGAVCIHSYTADGSGDDHDVCSGPPPWLVSHDHLMFFQHAEVIFPAKSPTGSLLVGDLGQQGDWPAHCTGAMDYKAEEDGNFGWTSTIYNGAGGVMIEHGGDTTGAEGLVDMGDFFCANGVGSIDDVFYDLDTRNPIFRVRRPIAVNATAPAATVAWKNGIVTIGGAGCNQQVDLRLGEYRSDAGK